MGVCVCVRELYVALRWLRGVVRGREAGALCLKRVSKIVFENQKGLIPIRSRPNCNAQWFVPLVLLCVQTSSLLERQYNLTTHAHYDIHRTRCSLLFWVAVLILVVVRSDSAGGPPCTPTLTL